MTEAEAAIAGELGRVLEAGDYRVGALIVTMAPSAEGDGDTRIVSAVGMRENDLTLSSAVDLVFLIRRLRDIANELEAQMPRSGEGEAEHAGEGEGGG